MKPKFFKKIDLMYQQCCAVYGDPSMWTQETNKVVEKLNQNIANEELWNTSNVEDIYGISKQLQSNLATQIPGRMKMGGSVIYLIEYSKPWFEHYIANRARTK